MKKILSKSMAWLLSAVMLFGLFFTANVAGLEVSAADNSNIQSHLDAVYVEDNAVVLRGWAFDNDDCYQHIDIHVYIGGKAGDSNAELHVIKADKLRADINNAYNCGNYHGFSDAILTNKTGSQMVYVYAVNVGAGSTNPFIGKCSLSIPNSSASNIKGYSDIICGEENAVFVEGWAFDKNDISKTITIDSADRQAIQKQNCIP